MPLLTIALASFAVHHLLILWAASVSLTNGPAGLGLLVLAVAIRLVLLGLGFYVAAAAIRIDGVPVLVLGARAGHAEEKPLPGSGFTGSVKMAIVPMVVLYAAWNQINWDIHTFALARFVETTARQDWDEPARRVDFSNINFQDGGWMTYIPWAVGIWVVKIVLDRVAARHESTALDFVIVTLECGWVVLGWLVVAPALQYAAEWTTSRVFWVDWLGGLGRLARELLWFDLPDLVSSLLGWLWQVLVTVSTVLVWPLVWVAVVGLLVGWVRGDTDHPVAQSHTRRSVRMLGRLFTSSTAEVRAKFYPVVTIGRAIWRAGPLPVLVIAGLYAALMALFGYLQAFALARVIPPQPGATLYYEAWLGAIDAVFSPVRTTLIVGCFALVLGLHLRQARPVSR